MKIKKSYSFALKTSLQIGILALIIGFLLKWLFKLEVSSLFIIAWVVLLMGFSFLIIQHRIEKFIYQRVKKIYEEVSLLDIQDLDNKLITSDMETLSKEVKKFANKKLSEIESLNAQALFRREYMGNVAHELKTPLFSIQGYLLTLLDGAVADKKIREKYLKQAAKNVERLVNIVEDLDLISKLDAKRIILNTEEFDLVSLTKNVFELLEINAKNKEIKLTFDQKYFPIMVVADQQRIEQVLINLITNAIKYGKKNSICMVKFEKVNAGKIKVSVLDEGEGITPEHLSRIFERFYRVESSRSREEGGSGLGLAIVKHIVEAHKEKVGVKSEKGKGSEFYFTLKTHNPLD